VDPLIHGLGNDPDGIHDCARQTRVAPASFTAHNNNCFLFTSILASSLTVSATKKNDIGARTTAVGILFTSVPLALVQKPLALGNPGVKLGIEPAIIFGPDMLLEYCRPQPGPAGAGRGNFAGRLPYAEY